MGEQEPQMIIDDDASMEQRAALGVFSDVAVEFSERELLMAMTIAEHPKARKSVVLFTDKHDKTPALIDAWQKVFDSKAGHTVSFDPDTENLINLDERIDKRKKEAERLKKLGELTFEQSRQNEEIPRQIMRIRFALFAGRLAASSERIIESAEEQSNHQMPEQAISRTATSL